MFINTVNMKKPIYYDKEYIIDNVTQQEVSNEILKVVIASPSVLQNHASLIIDRNMLPFQPRYDIRKFINEHILIEAKKKGFEYSRTQSDDCRLVFFMK